MGQHTQFLLMNTSRSGDHYAQYTGVPVEDLLKKTGILSSAFSKWPDCVMNAPMKIGATGLTNAPLQLDHCQK